MQFFKKIICILFSFSALLLTSCQIRPHIMNNYYYVNPGVYIPVIPQRSDNYQSEKCRIVCFSHGRGGSLYSLAEPGRTIYVKGFFVVPGRWDAQNICRPQGYSHADISALPEFKAACKIFVRSCGDNCWAGGNS